MGLFEYGCNPGGKVIVLKRWQCFDKSRLICRNAKINRQYRNNKQTITAIPENLGQLQLLASM
jgi:hypothetical protein